MTKAYHATIDEFADTTFRLLELQGHVRKQRWRCLALIPMTFVPVWLLIPGGRGEKLAFASFASVLAAVFYLLSYRDSIRGRLRKWVVKTFGSENPVACEYELTPNNLVFRMPGQERRTSWEHIVSVRRTPEAIEVETRPMDLFMLRNRIFAGPDEMETWHQFIRQRVEDARHPGAVATPSEA